MTVPNEGSTTLPSDALGQYHLGLWESGGSKYYAPRADGTASYNLKVALYDLNGNVLVKYEDAAHSSGDGGIMALGVRKDTAAALAGSDGDYQPAIFDASGRLHITQSDVGKDSTDRARMSLYAQGSSAGDTAIRAITATNDGYADGRARLEIIATQFEYDSVGNAWNRRRNNLAGTLLASAARTATTNSSDQTNYNARGVQLALDITATPNNSETLTLALQVKDPVSGKYVMITGFAALTASALGASPTTATYVYTIYPGAVETAAVNNHEVQGLALPRTWRVAVTHSSTGSWTYSVGYSLIN